MKIQRKFEACLWVIIAFLPVILLLMNLLFNDVLNVNVTLLENYISIFSSGFIYDEISSVLVGLLGNTVGINFLVCFISWNITVSFVKIIFDLLMFIPKGINDLIRR